MGGSGFNYTYVPIHMRSYYSLLRGVFSPEEICRTAREHGASAVGIADINNMYGLVRFFNAAASEGIKPVASVVVAPKGKPRFTAYVMEREGLARINQIITSLLVDHNRCHGDQTDDKFRDWDLVESDGALIESDGTLIASDEALIASLLENGWEGLRLVSDDTTILERLRERSSKGLYVKLTYERPIGSLAHWAADRRLPVIAVNEGVCASNADREVYRILRAIDLSKSVDDLPAEGNPTHFTASLGQMQRYFSAVPEALRNTQVLADDANSFSLLDRKSVFPTFQGMSEEESSHLLRDLCRRGVSRRFGVSSPAIEDRLAHELTVIREMGYSGYFLVVRDIVAQCPRTCGRGSSASSLVSYLLGITHVDPIKYDLFFERFLNAGRKEPPDIDIDLPWDERDSVFEYVFRHYPGRSAMVANHVTFGPRASVREAAKAYGADQREVGRLIRLSETGNLQAMPEYIRRAAQRIEGMVRYIGTHCGGVIITPDALTNHTHLQVSGRGYPVLAWDKESAKQAGLVKIDLLGNRSLAVLRDVLSLVETRHRSGIEGQTKDIQWERFNPVGDAKTRELIEGGDTIGVFYVESPATRQLLKKMGRGDYEHLVIASSIIRPAANEFIREFVDRLRGKPYSPLHPAMARTLKKTYGIMVYQEDVSRVAMAVAGFSAVQAERLRRLVSKGRHQRNRDRELATFRSQFMRGGESLGTDSGSLEEIWRIILSFTEYSFCKAHSASFALVSYKLAFMKRYFPLEFMVSVINNQGGFYSCQTYLNEVRRMGFAILPPDVNKSQIYHSPEGNAIRIGLQQLRNLSRAFLQRLVQNRETGGEYQSLIDFAERCSPAISELRVLIRCGALDRLADGVSRPGLFWIFFQINNSGGLFLVPPVPGFIEDYSPRTKLLDEVRTLGVMISRHPVGLFTRRIRSLRSANLPLITSRELRRFKGHVVSVAGLLVTGKEVWTKTNEVMSFVSFEDGHSVFESVFFPIVFRKFCRLLDQVGVFVVTGRVDEEHGALCINVQNLLRVCGSDFVPENHSQCPKPATPLAAKHSTRNCKNAMTP